MEYVTAQGVEVPVPGFGTSGMDDETVEYRAIEAALETGYRHFDTAQIYGSEATVGDVIADSSVDREDVFVTTKLSGKNREYDDVVASTRASCDRIGGYADLLLIHWPVDDVPVEETLRAMNDLRDDGVVRHLGVSNFSLAELREARRHSDAPLVTDQVEYHVRERRDDLLAYCIEEDLMLTAYSPIGDGELLDDETVTAVAERHDRTPAQVAIRWLLQQPQVAPIPMSSSPDHVRENFDVFGFELSDEEMRELFEATEPLDDDLAAALGL